MRPSYRIKGVGTLREITIWKAIVFGILTLGIYPLVVTYQNANDIQGARRRPFDLWVVFFWLGLFVAPLMLGLWVLSMMGLQEIREQAGLPDSHTGVVALILALFLPPVGQILWAAHVNATLREAGEEA